jgi:hypothetical protein
MGSANRGCGATVKAAPEGAPLHMLSRGVGGVDVTAGEG